MQTGECVSRYDRIMADIRAGKSDEYLIDTYNMHEIGAVKVYRMVCDGTISPGKPVEEVCINMMATTHEEIAQRRREAKRRYYKYGPKKFYQEAMGNG